MNVSWVSLNWCKQGNHGTQFLMYDGYFTSYCIACQQRQWIIWEDGYLIIRRPMEEAEAKATAEALFRLNK